MKKFLMTLVAAFGLAVSANAQTYVGGGFSIFGQDNGNTTVNTYKFMMVVLATNTPTMQAMITTFGL